MYASLAAHLEVEPILFKHGFVIVQVPIEAPGGWQLQTRLIHESGQELAASMPLIVGTDRNAMQALGSTLTYARRYSLQCLLCLHAEDDDGNGSGASAPPRQTPQEPRQRAQQSAPAKSQAPRQQPQGEAPKYPPGGPGLLAWLTDLTDQQRYDWVGHARRLGEPHNYPADIAEWDEEEANWAAGEIRAEMERRAKANQSKRR
jgi:hypothetical protein